MTPQKRKDRRGNTYFSFVYKDEKTGKRVRLKKSEHPHFAPPSIGKELSCNTVNVMTEKGRAAGEGEVGELVISGSNVVNGYLNGPQSSNNSFELDGFKTGDLGYFKTSPNGDRYFFITGRIKNIAKVGGETVSLEQMESIAATVNTVIDVACTSIKDESYGDKIIIFFSSCDSNAAALIEKELSRHFPKRLLPKIYKQIDNIPRTPTGKLIRSQLVEKFIIVEEENNGSK